jgi:hypothetical protein
MAYWQLEPTAETRIDVGFAQLSALLANINRDPKKRAQPYEAKDFLPQWGGKTPPSKMDPKVVQANLLAAFGGKVKRKAKSVHPPKA